MKLLAKPIGLLLGVLGGVIATSLFDRLWSAVTGEDDSPEPTDLEANWTKVVLAAVLQGALFAGVRAVLERAGAKGLDKASTH